jgi:4-amino-4-deoxy-L-arabinose transferase-like glycosyltransferase
VGRLRNVTPAHVAIGATLAFIAMTVWWTLADGRVPDYDNGRHLNFAFIYADLLSWGRVSDAINLFTNYPPLVHLVGTAEASLFGKTIDGPVIAQNVVFVPLLAVGCYGCGRIAGGPLAGALAVIFALGTPMIVSQFHVFMLDAPTAACVALAVFALLKSDLLRDTKWAAIAGAGIGLAAMAKSPGPIFIAGALLVVLLAGGWRQVRGLAALALLALLVAGPWYIVHYDEVKHLVVGFSRPAQEAGEGLGPSGGLAHDPLRPPRFSSEDFGWYVWNALNIQVLLPLLLFAAVGVVVMARQLVRARGRDVVAGALLAGGLVSYLGITYLNLHDPRYSLPAIVYLAVIGTAWIPQVRKPHRYVLVGALALVASVNFFGVSFGIGHPVRFAFLPDAPTQALYERHATLYSPAGYVVGGPAEDDGILEMMRAAKRDGARLVEFDPGTATIVFFNASGLEALGRVAGLHRMAAYDPSKLGPKDIFILRREDIDDPPCVRLKRDGSGVYMVRGNPLIPFEDYKFYCPV